MKPLINIVIINYNTGHFLDGCVKSLYAQTYSRREIIFIDNFSSDDSCEFIKKHFPNIKPTCNKKNLGYAEAANQGIRLADGKYVMILNPDVILEKNYLEKCVAKMEEDEKIAAIGGKIYKYDFQHHQKTNIIDTTGLLCYRNRRVVDRGQGDQDQGQFNTSEEVFGISGACPLYRKKALEDVKVNVEFFDKDFFMYKEDVDMAWRLRLFGWKCFYLATAIGYHVRGTGVLKRSGFFDVAKNRHNLSRFQKHYSYKNQRLMQIKNEMPRHFLRDFSSICWKEILMTGFMLFREPFLIKSWLKMLTQIPTILKKRHYVMQHKRVTANEMQKWFKN